MFFFVVAAFFFMCFVAARGSSFVFCLFCVLLLMCFQGCCCLVCFVSSVCFVPCCFFGGSVLLLYLFGYLYLCVFACLFCWVP